MSIRKRTLMAMGVAALSGGLLLYTSQRVQQAEDRLGDLQEELQHQEEVVDVLQAEWAYLNNPDRLEELATKYLDLKLPEPKALGLDPASLNTVPDPKNMNLERYPLGAEPVAFPSRKPNVSKEAVQ